MTKEIPKYPVVKVLDFLDVKVKVYYDKDSDENRIICSWTCRNPDSYYTGTMWMNNETGKITYPDGAVIPEQTERDRERIPKFILVGKKVLTQKNLKRIEEYLESDHKRRNKARSNEN